MNDENYYLEDLMIFLCVVGIFAGMIMTFLGIFISGESSYYWEYYLSIGLPLWIFSTVYITRGLTFESTCDISIALKDYSR